MSDVDLSLKASFESRWKNGNFKMEIFFFWEVGKYWFNISTLTSFLLFAFVLINKVLLPLPSSRSLFSPRIFSAVLSCLFKWTKKRHRNLCVAPFPSLILLLLWFYAYYRVQLFQCGMLMEEIFYRFAITQTVCRPSLCRVLSYVYLMLIIAKSRDEVRVKSVWGRKTLKGICAMKKYFCDILNAH